MAPTSSSTFDVYPTTRRSSSKTHHSQPEYGTSVSSEESRPKRKTTAKSSKQREEKPQWLSQVKSWLSVAEPSAQAMKDQKRATYKKHGVNLNDPDAAAKMHFPLGKVPAGAITSTSGPTPEKALKERLVEEKRRPTYTRHSRASQSTSSGISSIPSVKGVNPVAPWDE